MGCDSGDGGTTETPPLSVVKDAPLAAGAEPEVREIGAYDGDLRALGAQGDTALLGTSTGAFAALEGGLLKLDIYGDAPDLPVSTGDVRAVGRRTETLIVAAEAGIFITAGNKLTLSPASEALATLSIREIHVTGADATEQLWIVAQEGIFVLTGGKLRQISVEGATGEPLSISPAVNGSSLLVAYPEGVHEIDIAKEEAAALPHDLGEVRAMARGGEKVVYFGSDQGLFVRGEDGAYTQFTLSGGEEAAPVDTVLVDPDGVIAVTAQAAVRLNQDDLPQAVATLPASPEPHRAAADDVGLVWIGGGGTVSGYLLGRPAGYEADVAPILGEYCMSCHAEPGTQGAPALDMLDYETTKANAPLIVQRVAAGQMPPPGSPPLPAEKYELVLRWYSSGLSP